MFKNANEQNYTLSIIVFSLKIKRTFSTSARLGYAESSYLLRGDERGPLLMDLVVASSLFSSRTVSY